MGKVNASPRGGVTAGQHSFAQIPSVNVQRSSFDRSFGVKTTFDEGYLVPVFVDEVLPGDTFSVRSAMFARMATPLHPIMDNLFCDVFFFAVPIRLLWNNWERMNGHKDNPDDSTDFLVPVMTAPAVTGHAELSLSDYFGIPTKVPGLVHSSLWHRAYNLVFNEWFRDQNLVDSVVVDRDDGPDNPADYVLLRRGKRHDYFTSCLPFPQKGAAVELPLGDEAPVRGLGVVNSLTYPNNGSTLKDSMGDPIVGGPTDWNLNPTIAVAGRGAGDTLPAIYADLSEATAATINELRQAFQIQRMFERDARGGTRYTEVLRAHFGVISPDQRLQRPEYLGGGTFVMNTHPLPAMVEGPSATPIGQMGGFVTGSQVNKAGFTKSFTEHCVLLGLVSVRADLNYQQGLERMFSRRTRFDFYWPALANLGEQGVLNKEIYAQGTAADEEVFGYQERWAEYRYKPSRVTGLFRSNATQPLDTWHLAQEFEALPLLNETFIEEQAPVLRVQAVVNEPHFLIDCYFKMRCARPMPVYSVPGLIDHF